MRTIEVKLYQFHELPTDEAKEKARAWLRQAADVADSLESAQGDFEDILTPLGFSLKTARGCKTRKAVYWRLNPDCAGFDASWSADSIDPEKVQAMLADRPAQSVDADGKVTRHDDNAIIHGIAASMLALAAYDPFATGTTYSGRDGTTQSGEWSRGRDNDDDIDDDGVQEAFDDICKSLAHWFARLASAEYEYQMSDEAIDECLEANGYEFTEDGTRA